MSSTHDSRVLTREQRAVLARIQQICEFWDIDPSELRGRLPAAPVDEPVRTLAVKYRHPVTGETWDGLGPQPDWLRRALLKEGYRVAELLPS